jgi:hypothetical protein
MRHQEWEPIIALVCGILLAVGLLAIVAAAHHNATGAWF